MSDFKTVETGLYRVKHANASSRPYVIQQNSTLLQQNLTRACSHITL